MEKRQRVRIIELGPNDSWSRESSPDVPSPLGRTGEVIEILDSQVTTPGYVSCVIHLDDPILNYIVRVTLLEAKLERIDDNEGINTLAS